MGDFAVSDSAHSFEDVRAPSSPADDGIPPQVLARWAALAGAIACDGVVPRQVQLKS